MRTRASCGPWWSRRSACTLTSRAFRNDQLGPFYRELCELTGFERVLPMNSGAEAVETAMKAARKWAYDVKGVPDGKAEIIVCEGNFHGRTISIVSFSSEPLYRDGFGPLTPGFTLVPYGDADALEKAITPNTAAFLVEPIQGEGGVIVPPDGYLRAGPRDLHQAQRPAHRRRDPDRARPHRAGCFACDHEDVRARRRHRSGKALSGGFYPVSAVLASAEVLGVFKPGDHGSTFGGNPLACAVAREALQRAGRRGAWSTTRPAMGELLHGPAARDRQPARRGGPRQGPADRRGAHGRRPAGRAVSARRSRARGSCAKETHDQHDPLRARR